jgi:hypothetical protein
MNRIRFFKTVFLAVMLGLSVGNLNAQSNVRVLNASDIVCIGSGTCLNWTDSITGDPNPDKSQNIGGGYWDSTYFNTTGFGIGSFKLSHGSGVSQYSYWGGFTSGANGDTTNYGYADTTAHVGSVNWVPNQWGIMAGGGLSSTSPVTATKGVPYLIAYWNYFSDSEGVPSLQISLNGDSLFNLNELYICNHPWPYYGNYYGDGFARPLNRPGDHFDLIIHGVPATGPEVTATTRLAEYDPKEPFDVYQSPNWEQIKLPNTFSGLRSLYFTMYSTDTVAGHPEYGPNTAVYFCLDKLKVTKTGGVASAATVVSKAKVAAKPAIEVTDHFPIASYTGGDVTVHDATGKEVLKTTVKAGEKPNLSKLPEGEYRLRHGHKLIPVTKVGKGGK